MQKIKRTDFSALYFLCFSFVFPLFFYLSIFYYCGSAEGQEYPVLYRLYDNYFQ